MNCVGIKREKGLVSVLFMAYNHEAVIEDAIKSLLSQDYPNIEIIMLDDASSDCTTKIIDRYIDELKNKFVRVKTIYHEFNSGNIARNQNELLKEANGDYLVGLSADDVFMENSISQMVSMLEDNSECSIAYANMNVINDEWRYGDFVDENVVWISNQEDGILNHLFERLMYDNCIAAPTVIMRKSVIKSHGLHDENILHEDYEYWLRISRDEKVYYMNKPIMLYRVSQNSMTNYAKDNDNKKLLESLEVDYQVKKKYAQYLTDDQKEMCWQHYYAQYLSFCREKNCTDGIKRLEKIMSGLSIKIDERNDDYERVLARKEEEKKIMLAWDELKAAGKTIGRLLYEKGINRVAIYGYAALGNRLYKELSEEGIAICYVIDRRGRMINTNVDIMTLKDELFPVDCVINTVIGLNGADIDKIREKTMSNVSDLKSIITG